MARAGDGNSGRRRRGGRAGASAQPDDDAQPARTWHQTAQSWPDGDFAVRHVSGSAKTFRCPGCDQEVRPGTAHVVAWPEGRLDDRRHWHSACWANRLHRTPVVQRSRNAPRL